MDAVGADQHVAARGMPVRSVPVEEICGHAAVVLGERLQPAIEMNARFAEPSLAGLDPATHADIGFALGLTALNGKALPSRNSAWMRGSSPRMTRRVAYFPMKAGFRFSRNAATAS